MKVNLENNYIGCYPFGALMPNRHTGGSDYRYGFNGKEMDDEVKESTGTQLDYGFRIYDPRLGKFLSVDPLTKSFPMLTPYQYASNNPIKNIDIDGLEGTDANRKFLFDQMKMALNNYAIYSAEGNYCQKIYNSNDCGTNTKPIDFSGVKNSVKTNAPDWLSDWNVVKGGHKIKVDGKIMTPNLNMNVTRQNPHVNYVAFTNVKTHPNGEADFFNGPPAYYIYFYSAIPNEGNNSYLVASMSFSDKDDFVGFKDKFFDNLVDMYTELFYQNFLPELTVTSENTTVTVEKNQSTSSKKSASSKKSSNLDNSSKQRYQFVNGKVSKIKKGG